MRNKAMKKIVSFILAAVMVLSMTVVGVSADTAETRTADFENQTVGAAFVRANNWTINNGAAAGTTIMEEGGNKFVKLQYSNGMYTYPMFFIVSSFKISFDMMVPVLPGDSWCGFYFHSNMLDNNDIKIGDKAQFTMTWDKGNGGWLGNGGITPNVKAVESIQNVWHTVEIVRDGTKLEARVWEKGTERPDVATTTSSIPEEKDGAICPAFLWQMRDTSGTQNYVYLDNMVATTPYKIAEENDTAFAPEAGTTLYTSDFESGAFTAPFKTGGTASSVERGVQSETDNKYFAAKYVTAGASTSSAYIVPDGYTSDAYIYSGDLKWDVDAKTSGGYYGLYIKTGAGEDALMETENFSAQLVRGQSYFIPAETSKIKISGSAVFLSTTVK